MGFIVFSILIGEDIISKARDFGNLESREKQAGSEEPAANLRRKGSVESAVVLDECPSSKKRSPDNSSSRRG